MKRIVFVAVAALAASCSPKPAEPAAAAACETLASASAAEQATAGCGARWMDANVRIDQLQAMGTHNSYKQAIPAEIMALIVSRNAAVAETLDYSHRPLAEELDKGARQIELDPYDDPQGGAFSHPKAVEWLAQQHVTVPAYDLSVVAQPGIKVFHVSDIDYRSSCLLFTECLRQIKAWSDAHPTHSPILIMINPKHTPLSWPGSTPVQPFGGEAFGRMETEILSVFPRERLITPDQVRGTHATLREGAMAGGWPRLGEARGKVIFTIDDSIERTRPYVEGHPSLQGRLAFINSSQAPDAPEAAYFTMNEALEQQALIRERVGQGFLVRTRADADTREARAGTTERRETALASGAQYVSTDYLWPDERFGTGYTAALPDGLIVRCNPVSPAAGCDGKVE
jgi:hypothetical protein